MPASSEILQEYLISLGYHVDQISLGKFDESISKTGKNVLKVGGAIAGVVTTVEAAASSFAYSMRKVYFQSELSQSTVKNLNALGYAAKQVGIDSGTMTDAITGMARVMRLNPGMQGLIESFGVKVTGRDMGDVALDFVDALKKMPEWQGTQFASQFGIDPDTFHLMITHMDELKKKRLEMLEIQKQSGFDADKEKQTILEYTGAMDKLEEQLGTLGKAMLVKFIGPSTEANKLVSDAITFWTRWAMGIEHVNLAFSDFKPDKVATFLFGEKDPSVKRKQERALSGENSFLWNLIFGKPNLRQGPVSGKVQYPGDSGGAGDAASFLSGLEQKYGLPPGLMDSIWMQESSRGKHKTGKLLKDGTRAMGDFQLIPSTASAYGVKDPMDFHQSAEGAAHMLSDLLKQSHGNLPMALAGYNWGSGNLAKGGMDHLPLETINYIGGIMGRLNGTKLGQNGGANVVINSPNTFNITGGDASSVATKVASAQARVNADNVRNMRGAFQ